MQRLIALVLAVAVGGCGSGAARDTLEVPWWRLSAAPAQEIGVVEGDTNRQFHAVVSTLRLPDGRIVVADAGAAELRMFDADGQFIRRIGRRGGGPGEFRFIARLYPRGGDGLLVYDGAGPRLSVFDTSGAFVGLADIDSVRGDSTARMDVWLHRNFWVDGVLGPARRTAARRTLDRLPVPDATPLFRYVRAGGAGRLWIREPLGADTMTHRWTVVDSAAVPLAVIDMPVVFDVHVIADDHVLGRWRNADEVNFVHLYELERNAGRTAAPRWYAGVAASERLAPAAEERDEVLRMLRSAVRTLVVAQEGHFSDHGRYASLIDRLAPYGWTRGETVVVEIVANSGFGWSAVASHATYPLICGMGIGDRAPPGWPEGVPVCG